MLELLLFFFIGMMPVSVAILALSLWGWIESKRKRARAERVFSETADQEP